MALAAALIALCCAQPSIALPGQDIGTSTKAGSLTRDRCAGRKITVQKAGPFVGRVWRFIYWRRHRPKPITLLAYRNKLRCAGPGNRRAIKHRWREAKRAFYAFRRQKLRERAYLDAITPPGAAVLATIRSCESGGVYSTATGNGFWGAYQFTLSTWASVGGSGLPSEASPREQDERAARLYRESGASPWPVCGV